MEIIDGLWEVPPVYLGVPPPDGREGTGRLRRPSRVEQEIKAKLAECKARPVDWSEYPDVPSTCKEQ